MTRKGDNRPATDHQSERVAAQLAQALDDLRRSEERNHWFLASLERVDRTIRQAGNLDLMMADVLDTSLSVFGSDRAWLLYPCDPEAPSWGVPMERTKEQFPGMFAKGIEVPMVPEAEDAFRTSLQSNGPVIYDPQSGRPVPMGEHFGIRSQIVQAIYPKLGKPWLFGMHQCSHARIWTREEAKLFNEIGRRVADALSSLLFLRTLRESEEKLSSILASMDDFVFTLDRNGNFRDWFHPPGTSGANPRSDRFLGKSVREVFAPSAARKMEAAIAAVIASGSVQHFEYRADIDGESKWFHAKMSMRMDPTGGFAGVTVVSRDVTTRRQVGEALRESESKYRLLVENANEAIFIAQDEVIKFPNPMAEKLSGYTAQELGGISLLSLVHPEDREMIGQRYRTPLHEQEPPLDYSFRVVNKAGDTLWMQINSTQIIWEGKPAALCFLRDVTQQKHLESQFLAAQKMESVGRLAGGVAHDFNNLLTAIIGYCDLGLGRLGGEDPLRHPMEEIRKAANRCAEMTRQLLAFSRKQILVPRAINLNHIVVEIGTLLHRLIGEDIELSTLLAEELGNVMADPGQIEQVLVNLVINSRDAMPRGGKLTIETENHVLSEPYVWMHEQVPAGSYVTLSVSDTGLGMDEKTLSLIFEPFFTTKEKGTGLGLSTIYGIVRQSGGTILTYSEPGRGTTFKVFLPRTEKEVELLPRQTLAVEDLRGGQTVLVVEDDAAIRELACEILGRYGYHVISAGDGEEALQTAEGHEGTIDLLLTDVVMPRLGGKGLYDRLRLQRPEVRVLFMSGYTSDEIVHKGTLDPGTAFLQKPYHPTLLARKVKEVLSARG